MKGASVQKVQKSRISGHYLLGSTFKTKVGRICLFGCVFSDYLSEFFLYVIYSVNMLKHRLVSLRQVNPFRRSHLNSELDSVTRLEGDPTFLYVTRVETDFYNFLDGNIFMSTSLNIVLDQKVYKNVGVELNLHSILVTTQLSDVSSFGGVQLVQWQLQSVLSAIFISRIIEELTRIQVIIFFYIYLFFQCYGEECLMLNLEM